MNSIQRFLFKELNIRGQHVQINEAWAKLLKDRGYPEALRKLFGELTAMTIMLANGLKHQGKVTLQVQGQGPVNLLVVEATHELKLRGVAKTNQAITSQKTPDELLGSGQILVTLENTQTNHHFQSYVEREGDSLTASFENFFSQSEQLPTRLWLASTKESLAGLMIQKLPDTDHHDEDGWERIVSLTETIKDEELCELDVETLLHRLYHEETLELFESQDINYDCPKDITKIENMVKNLGEDEARRIIKEEGEIVIHNEICNFHIRLTEKDLDRIFARAIS